MPSDWKKTAAEKRESVNNLIPADWRIAVSSQEDPRDITGNYLHHYLSLKEIEITETDAVGIAEHTTNGSWTAVEVAKAFCHRAALAHQLTNCLLEIFFEAGIAQAEKLDEYYATHKKTIGPLHGVPVSLKDQFHVNGVETTMGYVGWVGTFQGKKGTGKEKVFESEMVKELKALGAVLYCKTSVPHTLMSGESNNNIMGYVKNPANRLLSAGGSSGGEGALIGLKGSPLGFGTDIGGSIRIPAAFNGLFGIRSSAGRLPYEGMANSMDGQNTVLSVVGPLATSLQSLQFVYKALLSQQPWLHDPLVVEMPWRAEQENDVQSIISSKKLSFGVLRHDGVMATHPPIQRAIDIVIKAMKDLGHSVIDWNPTTTHGDLNNLAARAWVYDGGADVHEAFALSGEPPVPQIEAVYGTKTREAVTPSHISETNILKREAQKNYMEYWNSTASLTGTDRPVDAIISPVAPFAAAYPETYTYVGYSMWVNALDYTSVVVPVTRVDKSIDLVDNKFKPLDKADEKNQKHCKTRPATKPRKAHTKPPHNHADPDADDPEIYDGAPVAIQLVGRRFQEEKMMAIAGYVSDSLTSQN